MNQMPFRRTERDISIGILRAANVFFSRFYHHVKICSPCTLPARGAGILVSNHLSGVDPALIQSACPRLVRWMMASEYFQVRAMRWLFNAVGVIPVDRNGRDSAATRSALRALEAGYILGVFPEGRIETERQLLPFQSGAAVMAARARVPIYPVYIEGTQRGKEMLPAILTPNRVRIRFGAPLFFAEEDGKRDNAERAMERVRQSMQNLRDLDQTRIE